MSETLDLPYYTIDAEELADWLDSQPDLWWIVDGDPILTSYVDFPCPSEELSAELRRRNHSLRMYDARNNPTANGGPVPVEQLDELADTKNNSHARTYLLCWEGEVVQWLLAEDLDAANEQA